MDHLISSFKRYLPNIIYDEKAVDHVLKRNYEEYTQDGGCCKCACSICVDTWCMGHLIYLC